MVNQQNTGNLINFGLKGLKFSFYLLSFPFTDFYELFNFFLKFCLTPVVSHVFL